MSSATDGKKLIEELRRAGKLQALPIVEVDKRNMTLRSCDGRVLREYGVTGTWVPTGKLHDGTIRYLGSASHAGHIELKALFVMVRGYWHNILSGAFEPHIESWLPDEPKGCFRRAQ